MNSNFFRFSFECIIYGYAIKQGISFISGLIKDIPKVNNNININIENKNYVCFKDPNDLKYLNSNYITLLDCPILLNTIYFPIIDKYGFTYDKDGIVNWLIHNQICPLNRKSLNIKDLRINKNVAMFVKFLILKEKFNSEHPKLLIKKEEILD